MELCENFFDFHILSFLVFSHDFVIYIDIIHVAALNTATSQIRSHIQYLIQTYNILLRILYLKLMRNVATLEVFNTI